MRGNRHFERRLLALERAVPREPELEFDCSTIDYSALDHAEFGEFGDLLRSFETAGPPSAPEQARFDYLLSKLMIKPAASVEQEEIKPQPYKAALAHSPQT